jgi:hypothetical protein
MENIEELINKQDLSKLSEIRQDILNEILFYKVELTKILDSKERYDILKIETTLQNELRYIGNKISSIENIYRNNFNFYRD